MKHPLTIGSDSALNVFQFEKRLVMFKSVIVTALLAAGLLSAPSTASAGASTKDAQFFTKLIGKWKGPGEIVAGKYKGTKFVCDFDGSTPQDKMGMTMDGSCRVGVFSQKMSAVINRAGKVYKGRFLDGAAGEGLDVVGGSVSPDRVVLTLKRKQLNGAMLARMPNNNQMNVTISVHVNDELVPVIGMKLSRIDSNTVGAVK